MRIEAVQGDITTQDVDVIVNAANSSLLGGGGVDGAIHAAAGPELLAACRELRRTTYPDGLPPGDAVATPGFGLPARWVVHTVGPNLHAGQDDPTVLGSCFSRSLEVAVELGARSIAFPAISAGVYGWDVADVARIGVGVARIWEAGVESGAADGHPSPHGLDLVRFVLFSAAALDAFEQRLAAPGRHDE
ncbi:hypothetical protein Cch01nite_21280 [Cellulomonas chitinilytica]|uniref:Macro domain-containing protein n=1 Tax=Cellulomonas chitinilytica TaxID=398759 RepID=A0A919P5K5_9CELL|nr:O-acetyl-ADP-ribose deacetylase [Cellulomonas chitinilytica]GIG21404.1 hypothetical protein Cch01nite_21280 [Cellulomonas chitinilytica]